MQSDQHDERAKARRSIVARAQRSQARLDMIAMSPINGVCRAPEQDGFYDLELERSVLGAFLIYPELLLSSQVAASDFYSSAHEIIFQTLLELVAGSGEVDTARLRGALHDSGRLKAVGDDEYLLGLTDAIPSKSVDTHRLRRLARARMVQQAATHLSRARLDQLGQALARLEVARAELSLLQSADASAVSPAQLALNWSHEGPLVRVATCIEPFDTLCRGGLPLPWRVMLVGAPSAGKTFIEAVIAHRLAGAAGLCVGMLLVDEEPDDVTIRFAQMLGFDVAQIERRDPAVMADLARALEALRIRLYDARHTIESATTDLAAWARSSSRRAALFFDSIQTVRSELAAIGASPRELVEANVRAMRIAATQHAMLVIATCEANRAAYRDADAVSNSNDMAAGAESRAIEFGAQTQLMLRTPKGFPDVVHVRVAKNRRAHVGEFWLKIDREKHELTPCSDPSLDPLAAQKADDARRDATRGRVEQDARTLAKIVAAQQGVGERELRTAVKVAGLPWGRERLDAAKLLLTRGVSGTRLVNRGDVRAHRWHVEALAEPERT